jgi:hypothetical protein
LGGDPIVATFAVRLGADYGRDSHGVAVTTAAGACLLAKKELGIPPRPLLCPSSTPVSNHMRLLISPDPAIAMRMMVIAAGPWTEPK